MEKKYHTIDRVMHNKYKCKVKVIVICPQVKVIYPLQFTLYNYTLPYDIMTAWSWLQNKTKFKKEKALEPI